MTRLAWQLHRAGSARSRLLCRAVVLVFLGLSGAPALPTPAAAQSEQAVAFGERLFIGKARCSGCHGWAGDGVGMDAYTGGANLRETLLDDEGIRETIRCGRIGTSMPSHDRIAFRDGTCIGVKGLDPQLAFPQSGVPLHAREIDALTRYVADRMRGRGEVTLAECTERWGEGSPLCNHLDRAEPDRLSDGE